MNAHLRHWKRGLLVVAIAASVPLLLAAGTPTNRMFDEREAREVGHTAWALVAEGPSHHRFGVYARAFAAYAMVNVARAGRGPGDSATYDALIAQVASPEASSAFPGSVELAGHRLASSVALRGHLALMLEARDRLGPLAPEQARFRDALTGSLAAEVLAAKGHLLTTEPGVIYPADNEVLLAALTLAARRGDPTVIAAAQMLRGALDALWPSRNVANRGHATRAAAASTSRDALDAAVVNGFAPSRLDAGTLAATDVPRGCALAYSVLFRALTEDAHAPERYAAFRDGFFAERGPLAGFREWPDGDDRRVDADSGPIILELGASASAFGLAAARLENADDYTRLDRTGRLARVLLVGGPRLRDLSDAIWGFAVTATPW